MKQSDSTIRVLTMGPWTVVSINVDGQQEMPMQAQIMFCVGSGQGRAVDTVLAAGLMRQLADALEKDAEAVQAANPPVLDS